MALAHAVVRTLCGITFKAQKRVTSLGTGLGAGTRRNATQARKRLKAFVASRSRFKMLKASRVRADRLLRTGGNASMIFGQNPAGVSNALLADQRRAAASATRLRTCGADLDLTLMMADAKSKGAADPAFAAHVGVLHMWALAVWEEWAPGPVLQIVMSDAQKRLGKAKSIWSVVYGPAAAVVATAWRLEWQVISATVFVTDRGEGIDLMMLSPAYVQNVVHQSVLRWRWRRIESKFPSLSSGGLGLGAAWHPISKALHIKDSTCWGLAEKNALASAVCGRQWPQQRLHKAGLVNDNLCRLCKGMPGGDHPGTLLHRWVCPALAAFREIHMPRWISDYLRLHGHRPSSSLALALARGLVPEVPDLSEKRAFSIPLVGLRRPGRSPTAALSLLTAR